METRSLCGLLGGLVEHCICFGVDGTSCVGVVVVSPAGFELDWWDVADGFEEPAGNPVPRGLHMGHQARAVTH